MSSYVRSLKTKFPFFKSHPQVAYFDNAATVHKPDVVIQELIDTSTDHYAAIRRGIYATSEEATQRFEQARACIASWCGVQSEEVIFTKNATDSLNLVALSWAAHQLKYGDQIVLSVAEHHSNLIPWQQLAQRQGLELVFVGLRDFQCDNSQYLEAIASSRVKLVAMTGLSNVVGALFPVHFIVEQAHARNIPVVIDAAQMAPYHHMLFKECNADFIAFSGHKIGAPTGIGVLIARERMHKQMQPVNFGGGMLYSATFEHTELLPAPRCFEAGTPFYEGACALKAAVDFAMDLDWPTVTAMRIAMMNDLITGLGQLPRIKIIGDPTMLREHGHLCTFVVEGIHAHDVAAYLDTLGIYVRAGNFCAQPLLNYLGLDAAVRVSLFWYNDQTEIERLLAALKTLCDTF